jgi:hypothetical protein
MINKLWHNKPYKEEYNQFSYNHFYFLLNKSPIIINATAIAKSTTTYSMLLTITVKMNFNIDSNMGNNTITNTITIIAGNMFFIFNLLEWNILAINSNFILFQYYIIIVLKIITFIYITNFVFFYLNN